MSGGFYRSRALYGASLSKVKLEGPPAVKQVGLSVGWSILLVVVVAAAADGCKGRNRIRLLLLVVILRRSKTSRRSSLYIHTELHIHCVFLSFLYSFSCCARKTSPSDSSSRMTRRNFYFFPIVYMSVHVYVRLFSHRPRRPTLEIRKETDRCNNIHGRNGPPIDNGESSCLSLSHLILFSYFCWCLT